MTKEHGWFRLGLRWPPWTGAIERGESSPSGFPERETARSGEGSPAGNTVQIKTRGHNETRALATGVRGRRRKACHSETPAQAEIRPKHKKTTSTKSPPKASTSSNPTARKRRWRTDQ